jgi:uncharacterized protein with HEPN domain
MRPEVLKHLYDVQEAATFALSFVEGHTLDDFLTNELLRSAVERKLLIVGEAMVRLRGADPVVLAQITDSHGYDVIDDEAVWDILQKNIPILLAESKSLQKLGDTGPNTDPV